jgi:hypothetical protein
LTQSNLSTQDDVVLGALAGYSIVEDRPRFGEYIKTGAKQHALAQLAAQGIDLKPLGSGYKRATASKTNMELATQAYVFALAQMSATRPQTHMLGAAEETKMKLATGEPYYRYHWPQWAWADLANRLNKVAASHTPECCHPITHFVFILNAGHVSPRNPQRPTPRHLCPVAI